MGFSAEAGRALRAQILECVGAGAWLSERCICAGADHSQSHLGGPATDGCVAAPPPPSDPRPWLRGLCAASCKQA
eukprot:COSAG01_NODE_7095_length_3355_cov_2.836916_5_plen_75_part_00